MIKFVLTALTLLICLTGDCQQSPVYKIPDGLYLIIRTDTVETRIDNLSSNQIPVFFSKLFEDFNSEAYLRIIIDTTEYVPLELEKAPVTEQPTDDDKKKLLLSLTNSASEKLKIFTTKHVMKHVALVVNGEALTMHKIKEPLTSGLLQITRCNDNACELLLITLKDNIKPDKE